MGPLRQGIRYARGLHRFLRDPVDAAAAPTTVRDEQRRRADRFLASLEHLVWPIEDSPHRLLLDHAGLERADVAQLVVREGLEGALEVLRDQGVRLSHDEARGATPVRRGSLVFTVTPQDLVNPLHPPDLIAGTSGTTGPSTAVPMSFRSLRRMAVNLALTDAMWGVDGAPHALWRPGLPSSGGLIAALAGAAGGNAPMAWFSPTDPADPSIARRKRLANRMTPLLAALSGNPLPAPLHVPTYAPDAVLAWVRDAITQQGRAALNAYPSSAVALAVSASERSSALHGLVIRMVGEPVTPAKLDAVRASGAEAIDAYAFAQLGVAATSCRECAPEELHLLEHEAAVIDRPGVRADGEAVRLLLWTSLSTDARMVLLNTENDDHGSIGERHCDCLLGRAGMTRTIRQVRGVSRSVARGVTVCGDALVRLVEQDLPSRFGGHPLQWQLVETERDGQAVVTVRADPRLGELDVDEIRQAVLDSLRQTDAGALAAGVWSTPGGLVVQRARPVTTAAGKTLPYHVI
ncbi:MAG TPA: hypothetical protein DCS55_02675 [Acidimicrobiaceae bacterium]|nr:hypothetical protein [Acidimicrobiaceae bacterium]